MPPNSVAVLLVGDDALVDLSMPLNVLTGTMGMIAPRRATR